MLLFSEIIPHRGEPRIRIMPNTKDGYNDGILLTREILEQVLAYRSQLFISEVSISFAFLGTKIVLLGLFPSFLYL